ncbi:MAG: ABC-type dipeptide/oligopeptide/nickel transport system, permease component [Candidatus Methanohalarchaeum thermophilum]|uniref:ABC-type dipeptide/oligopeptide/nickel transport system, permease component n=1 Tax=Methanohalarchaeum thermophilum TaxID=1903181 RepID=A0A1Q6DTU6_METT1|nr:MAG: ABC-type dipeptide/oligopeptide/nickel transport system, permease component [Candidatus Methanohalarchaeum thermophilum]
MDLRDYIIRRLLLLIPVLFGITLLIFAVLMLFSPSQRAAVYATSPKALKNIDVIIQKYGLNEPIYVQYFTWLKQVLSGNLGFSQIASRPVLEAILDKLPATFELALFSAPLILIPGFYLGTVAATHKDKLVDQFSRVLAIVGWSLPTFWLGLILLMFFSGILPTGRLSNQAVLLKQSEAFTVYTGMNTVDALLNGKFWMFFDAVQHLILPAVTLAVVSMAALMRIMRSSMLEELRAKYVTTARAKGLKEETVINKHARRNALISPVTTATWMVALLFNGVAVVEIIFNYKGIGWLFIRSAQQLDIATVLGFSLFNGLIIMLFNLLADILYAYLDPRINY